MKVVDFIIGGAPKCGTTALWNFLDKHPDIYLSPNKEPKFFTRIEGTVKRNFLGNGPRLSGTYNNGFNWYKELFKNANINQLKGEASTLYFCNEDSPDLIYKSNPDTKIIFMLRDPVKRLYSHYWQEYKLGYNFPSFEEMIKMQHPRFLFYKNVSSYKKNLNRYVHKFKKDNILILIQEEFEEDTDKQFQKVLNFLNVKTEVDLDLNKRYNIQRTPKNRELAKLYSVMQNSSIKKVLPKKIVHLLGKTYKKLAKGNSIPFNYPPLAEETYLTLKKNFKDDEDYVKEYLKRDFQYWKY